MCIRDRPYSSRTIFHLPTHHLGRLDWLDADVVFSHSTCYDEALLVRLGALAAGLKPGAFVLSVSKPMPSPALQVNPH